MRTYLVYEKNKKKKKLQMKKFYVNVVTILHTYKTHIYSHKTERNPILTTTTKTTI